MNICTNTTMPMLSTPTRTICAANAARPNFTDRVSSPRRLQRTVSYSR